MQVSAFRLTISWRRRRSWKGESYCTVHTETGWKLRSNKEVNQNVERISETMRKRRYIPEHLYRMDENKQTKQIFDYQKLETISYGLTFRRPKYYKRNTFRSKGFGHKHRMNKYIRQRPMKEYCRQSNLQTNKKLRNGVILIGKFVNF